MAEKDKEYIPSFEDTEEYIPEFEDTEELQAQEEIPQEEAILQGATRGVTMGFGCEIAGGFEAAGRAIGLTGLGGPVTDIGLAEEGPTLEKEELLKAYREGKAAQARREQEAREASPKAFLASEIGGAFATPLPGAALAKTGKIGKAVSKILPSLKGTEKVAKAARLAEKAKKLDKFQKYIQLKKAARAKSLGLATREGIKAGTITGIAESKADLTQADVENTKKLIKDAAAGGAIGGLFSAGLVKGGQFAGDLIKAIPGVSQALDSFSFGLKGTRLDSDLTAEKIKKASINFLQNIDDRLNQLGKNKKKILNMIDDAGITLNTKEDLVEARKLINNIESKTVKKDAQKFLDILDDYIGEGTATKKAREKLQKELAKAGLQDPAKQAQLNLQKKATKRAIEKGELPTSVSEQVVPGIDEGVEAAVRTQKIPVGEELVEKTTAQPFTRPSFTGIKKTVDPDTGREILSISDKLSGKIKSVVTDVPSTFDAEKLTTNQANNLIQRMRDYSSIENNENLPPEVRKAATQAIVKIKDKLSGAAKEIKQPLDEINKKISSTKVVQDILNLSQKRGKEAIIKNQKKLAKFIAGISDNNPLSDKSVVMKELRKVDPEMAAKVSDEIDELRRLYELSRPVDQTTESYRLESLIGSAHNIINKAFNAVGRGVGAITKAPEGKVTEALKKATSDKYKRAVLPNQTLRIIESTPDEIQTIINRIQSSGDDSALRYINPLKKALDAETLSRKNSILWGLTQQPAFRQLFNLYQERNPENIIGD